MKKDDALDIFGNFIVSNLLDQSISYLRTRLYEKLEEDTKMPKAFKALEDKIELFSETQKKTIEELFSEVLVQEMVWFLLSLEHERENDNVIKIVVGEENVAGLSHDLTGEIFGMNGWVKKFSEYKDQITVI